MDPEFKKLVSKGAKNDSRSLASFIRNALQDYITYRKIIEQAKIDEIKSGC